MFDEYTRGEWRHTWKTKSESDPTGFYIYLAVMIVLFAIAFIGICVDRYKSDHKEPEMAETANSDVYAAPRESNDT